MVVFGRDGFSAGGVGRSRARVWDRASRHRPRRDRRDPREPALISRAARRRATPSHAGIDVARGAAFSGGSTNRSARRPRAARSAPQFSAGDVKKTLRAPPPRGAHPRAHPHAGPAPPLPLGRNPERRWPSRSPPPPRSAAPRSSAAPRTSARPPPPRARRRMVMAARRAPSRPGPSSTSAG